MKTDVANNNTVNSENSHITDSLKGKPADEIKVVKGVRRTLQPLQKTAGDKENLVGAGRSPMPPNKEKLSVLSDVKPSKKLKPAEPRRVTIEDLTTNAQPSGEYWEALAERRRVALEKALEENQRLSERIAVLEEENAQANSLLQESRQIVEALTEMLQEKEDFDDESEVDPNSSF
uniref:Geminin n=1 Tax=Lygus hesperus TaxID=30085 RepID=A0A0A9W8P4_LYGHE